MLYGSVVLFIVICWVQYCAVNGLFVSWSTGVVAHLDNNLVPRMVDTGDAARYFGAFGGAGVVAAVVAYLFRRIEASSTTRSHLSEAEVQDRGRPFREAIELIDAQNERIRGLVAEINQLREETEECQRQNGELRTRIALLEYRLGNHINGDQ